MLKAADLHDFVHGFTQKCHEMGIRDDRQVTFLLAKAAAEADGSPQAVKGTEEGAKTDEDYYRGTGKLVTDLADIMQQGQETGGEVNGVNPSTNQGTSENYQRA